MRPETVRCEVLGARSVQKRHLRVQPRMERQALHFAWVHLLYIIIAFELLLLLLLYRHGQLRGYAKVHAIRSVVHRVGIRKLWAKFLSEKHPNRVRFCTPHRTAPHRTSPPRVAGILGAYCTKGEKGEADHVRRGGLKVNNVKGWSRERVLFPYAGEHRIASHRRQ